MITLPLFSIWGVVLEDFIRLFRERLFIAFFNWLDVNQKAIGDKWYNDLYKKGKDAEAECNTIMLIMGDALWMMNMIANLGVLAGVGPNKVNLQGLAPGLDEASSKRLLTLISASLGLQGMPKEILHQEVPIISSKKFSLELFAHGRASAGTDAET
jgi:hypothetical protein